MIVSNWNYDHIVWIERWIQRFCVNAICWQIAFDSVNTYFPFHICHMWEESICGMGTVGMCSHTNNYSNRPMAFIALYQTLLNVLSKRRLTTRHFFQRFWNICYRYTCANVIHSTELSQSVLSSYYARLTYINSNSLSAQFIHIHNWWIWKWIIYKIMRKMSPFDWKNMIEQTTTNIIVRYLTCSFDHGYAVDNK